MERKIGEIFEHNGEWYQCVKDDYPFSCQKCCFYNGGDKKCCEELTGYCSSGYRSDGKEIIFKKLKKVGKPYMHFGRIVQRYKGVTTPVERPDEPYMIYYGGSHEIDIEIKNKEIMEENKMNLKPFDLEAAKLGKPVCTRDGRKARIICFDKRNNKTEYPIIALVETDEMEEIFLYTDNGEYLKDKCDDERDLMMLPEKKTMWANIYRNKTNNYVFGELYPTEEIAIESKATMERDYITTVKIEWEE